MDSVYSSSSEEEEIDKENMQVSTDSKEEKSAKKRAASEMDSHSSTDHEGCNIRGNKKTPASAASVLVASGWDNHDVCGSGSKDMLPGGKEDGKECGSSLSVAVPKHNWTTVKSVMSREYGKRCSYSPALFRFECYGSLHMVERLKCVYKMNEHRGGVNAVSFNTSGTMLVSGSDDSHFALWNWTTHQPVSTFNTSNRNLVLEAKFLPLTDSDIITAGENGQVCLFQLLPYKYCKVVAEHESAVHQVATHSDARSSFLSCGEDGVIFYIDLREQNPRRHVIVEKYGITIPLYSISFNPVKPHEYIVGGRDSFVRMYDARQGQHGLLKTFSPEHLVRGDSNLFVTSVVYSYDGKEILASYNGDDIYLFEGEASNTLKFMHRYTGHRNSLVGRCPRICFVSKGVNFFGSKSENVVSASDCGHIFFWDKKTERIVNIIYGDKRGAVLSVEPHPTMPVLASSGLAGDVNIFLPISENAPFLWDLELVMNTNTWHRDYEKQAFVDFFSRLMYHSRNTIGNF